MRKRLLIIAALAAASTALFAQTPAWPPSPDHLTMPLWPNGAPGAQPSAGPEGDMTTAKDGSPGGSRSSVSAMFPIPRLRSTRLKEQTPEPPWLYSLGVVTASWPSISKGPKYATGSIRLASAAFWLSTVCPSPAHTPNLRRRYRMLSALSASYAPTPPSGTLIQTASESWASPPALILPPP